MGQKTKRCLGFNPNYTQQLLRTEVHSFLPGWVQRLLYSVVEVDELVT